EHSAHPTHEDKGPCAPPHRSVRASTPPWAGRVHPGSPSPHRCRRTANVPCPVLVDAGLAAQATVRVQVERMDGAPRSDPVSTDLTHPGLPSTFARVSTAPTLRTKIQAPTLPPPARLPPARASSERRMASGVFEQELGQLVWRAQHRVVAGVE